MAFNRHIAFLIKDDNRNIINRAQGFKKFFQGRQQRVNGLAFFHRSRIIDHQYDVERDKFTAFQRFNR